MSKPLLERFFRAETNDVLHWFASLPNAYRSDLFVYVPGTREPNSRVLLCAHADTVGVRPPDDVRWSGNIATAERKWSWEKGKPASAYSYARRVLGGDDRAGCALLWTFRNSGHSLLICDEEERGCIGAQAAADELREAVLGEHLFALEVDRRGDQNFVYYDTESDEFDAYLRATLGDTWHEETGSFSDIAVICEEAGICGANLAAGYLYEHTSDETFFLDAWQRTRAGVERLLNRATVRYPLTQRPKQRLGIKFKDASDAEWYDTSKGPKLLSSGSSSDDPEEPDEGERLNEFYKHYGLKRAPNFDDCDHDFQQSAIFTNFEFCHCCGAYSDGYLADPDELAEEMAYM